MLPLWSDRASRGGRFRHERPADRRLRPALRLHVGRAGEPRRLGRLAVLPALRQSLASSAACSTTAPGTGRSVRPPMPRSPGATSTARCSSRPPTPSRPVAPRWWTVSQSAATSGATSSAPSAPGVLMRSVTGLTGTVEFEVEFAPRPEYGLIYPVAARRRRRSDGAGRRRRVRALVARALRARRRRARGASACHGRGR